MPFLYAGKRPFLVGGEHLVTLGAFRAVAQKYPDVHIVPFRRPCRPARRLSGSKAFPCRVLHRCWELVGDDRIFQFGIRSGDRYEWEWGKEHVHTQRFNLEGLGKTVEKLNDKPVYLLHLDALDPSVFPGTGTPEPGGISFEALRIAATPICSQLNIVGCDVNELSPHLDPSGVSTAVACKIIREMLLAFPVS